MPTVYSGVGCNLDQNLLQSILPLLQDEQIESLEWSFDTLFNHKNIPDWFVSLLKEFGKSGRLVGHGVFGSLFSGCWSAMQSEWLKKLEKSSKVFQFAHITEHFGFMTGQDFHKGAPLNLPMDKTVLNIGIDRLKRLQNAANCPVGIENLAVAYHLNSVKQQGNFLSELVESVNGFIILDLHNLYCQIHNFEVDFEQIIQYYPLEKVKEIHISGGSWSKSQAEKDKIIRRDTHDAAVPIFVFEILEKTLKLCPNIEFVMLEQLGIGLKDAAAQEKFRLDFIKMKLIVQKAAVNCLEIINIDQNNFLPAYLPHKVDKKVLENESLAAEQRLLSDILEQSLTYEQAIFNLQASKLQHTSWEIEFWQPTMVETAWAIAQKWKNGF
jgi:uncharacterized protein